MRTIEDPIFYFPQTTKREVLDKVEHAEIVALNAVRVQFFPIQGFIPVVVVVVGSSVYVPTSKRQINRNWRARGLFFILYAIECRIVLYCILFSCSLNEKP